jgi:hypothetical protein
MRGLLRFIFKGPGVVLVFVAIILCVSWVLAGADKRQKEEIRKHSKERELGTLKPSQKVDSSSPEKEQVLEDRKLSPVQSSSSQVAFIPAAFAPSGKQPGVTQLVAFYAEVAPTPIPTPTPSPTPTPKPPIPEIFLPRGTFIACQLVNTVESSHINTPVVGVVTMNVYEQGHLIIPAGSNITSWAQNGAIRDRIEVAGKWSITFPDGREFSLDGVACDREADPSNQHFGLEDGSAGLQGEIIESDHWANAKAFIALLMTATLQTGTAVATSALQAQHTTGVTSLPDTTPVLSKYLDQLLNGETGDGRFVRVRSGKEFYVFSASVVFPTQRSIGARRQEEENKSESPPVSLDRMDHTLSETLRALREAGEQPKSSPSPTPFSYK